ncbi:DUF6337 family protein [Dryocola sp. BD586]|uniref:DUF6337 family protein n=1 Tax=Dryocola sp. BD586 TaxID=3133271 RepID=UPI003F508BE1
MVVFFCLMLMLGTAFDYYIWKKITPCMVSFVGVFFIIFVHALIGEPLGFIAIEPTIYIFILLFYVVGLTASISCAFLMASLTRNIPYSNYNISKKYPPGVRTTILSISFAVALLCLYFIFHAWQVAGSFVSDDFEGLLSYGVIGHVFSLLVALIPFVLKCFHTKRSKSVFLFIVFILFLLFMKQVKYWVMIPLVWIFWYSMVAGYIKMSAKKILLLCVLIVSALILLFFSVYFMKVVFSGDEVNVDYGVLFYDIMIHFFGYLYSGVLTFSVFITKGMYNNLVANDILGLFSGPVNIINLLLGDDLINLTLPKSMEIINTYSGTSGNVPTIWGTLLMAAGYYSFIIYFMIIFFVSFLQWMTKYSGLFYILYTFMTSFLFFSWFDYYYYLLMPFEVIILCSIFYLIFERGHLKNSQYISTKTQ